MTKTKGLNSPGTPATVRSLRRNKEAFYKTVWPALEQEGWTKIDASESMNGKPIFIPKVKVMELKEGQKGEDFYDDEEAVIARLLERRNTTESSILDKYLAEVGTNASSEVVREKPQVQLQRLNLDAEGGSDQETTTEAENGPSDSEHPHDQRPVQGYSGRSIEAMEVDHGLNRMEGPGKTSASEGDQPVQDDSGSSTGSSTENMEVDSGLEKMEEPAKMSVAERHQPIRGDSGPSIEGAGDSALDGMDDPGKMSASEGDQPIQDDSGSSTENMEVDSGLEKMEEPGKMSVAEHHQPIQGDSGPSIEGAGESGLDGMDEPGKMSASEGDQSVQGDTGHPIEATGASGPDGMDEPGKMSGSGEDQPILGNFGDPIEGTGISGLNGMEEPGMVPTQDHGFSPSEAIVDGDGKSKGRPLDEAALVPCKDKIAAGDVQILAKHKNELASPMAAEEDSRERKRQRTSGSCAEAVSEQVDGSAHEPQGDSFANNATVKGASAKKERPKRSTSKNKSAKTAPTTDYDERKGKGSHDLSDQDGSVYHSSDESHQERKRKRRAASATQSGGRSRGGRSRGRARRKPRRPPSPKRPGGTSPKPRGSRKAKQASTALMDLSWKNGGKNFPKKESRVGPQYNATSIEPAGTWKEDESHVYCQQIWDPEMAEQKIQGESKDFLATRLVPHNKREAAMIGLAEVGYDAAKFDEQKIVDNVITKDGSEWTEEERRRYHLEIFRFRKNIREVSRVTGKSMNSCFAYYLGTFKKSDDYRLLKSVCYQERLRRLMDSEHDLDACAICGDGGNLLICDGCECEYHMECCRPALKIIPEGRWECDECVDRQFVTAKDSLIRNRSLFERLQQSGGGKEDGDGEQPSREPKNNNAEGSGSLRVRPTSQALDLFSKLAQNINAAFTEGGVPPVNLNEE